MSLFRKVGDVLRSICDFSLKREVIEMYLAEFPTGEFFTVEDFCARFYFNDGAFVASHLQKLLMEGRLQARTGPQGIEFARPLSVTIQ